MDIISFAEVDWHRWKDEGPSNSPIAGFRGFRNIMSGLHGLKGEDDVDGRGVFVIAGQI